MPITITNKRAAVSPRRDEKAEIEKPPGLWQVPIVAMGVCIPACLVAALLYHNGNTDAGPVAVGFGMSAAGALVLGIFLQWRAYRHAARMEKLEHDRERMQLAFDKEKLELARWARARGAAAVTIDAGVAVTLYHPPPRVVRITEEKPALAIASHLPLPGFMLMQEVMRKWDLSPENLFLGYGKGSQALACSLDGFLHVAHDAPTGGGKTAQFYAEIIMLLKIGVRVILANPHFAAVSRKGEDWRPIAKAIEAQGPIELAPGVQVPGLMRGYQVIFNMLRWLSTSEIDRRFEMQARGNYNFMPLYIFIDEWPAIVSRFPDAAGYLVDVLQRGRAVLVCVDSNSQGFLQKDVQLTGSARENFSTAFHMGGNVHSGSNLLDMPVKDLNALLKDEQVALGKGIAMLRNNEASPQAQLVRLPLADNAYCYYMLGKANDWTLPEMRNGAETVEAAVSTLEAAIQAHPGDTGSASRIEQNSPFMATGSVSAEKRATIRRLKRAGESHRNIAKRVGLSGRKWDLYRAVCKEEGI